MTLAVEWLAVGALLFALGALIKVAGWTFLIAGYDESSPIPEEVAADMVGNTVIRVGVALLAVGAAASLTTLPGYVSPLVGVAVALDLARLLYRLNTYAPAES